MKITRYIVVLSSCGNPDFGENPRKQARGAKRELVPVESLAEASKACRAYIERHGLGGGNWNGGAVLDAATDRQVAHVSVQRPDVAARCVAAARDHRR